MSNVTNFNNMVRRTGAEDGGAAYLVEVSPETEHMIAAAASFHECKREAILAVALSIYVAAFEESVTLAMTARDEGPIN